MSAIAAAKDKIREATQQRAEYCVSSFWRQQLQCWTQQQAEPAEVTCEQNTLGLLNPTTLLLVVLLVVFLVVLLLQALEGRALGVREKRSSRLQTPGL